MCLISMDDVQILTPPKSNLNGMIQFLLLSMIEIHCVFSGRQHETISRAAWTSHLGHKALSLRGKSPKVNAGRDR